MYDAMAEKKTDSEKQSEATEESKTEGSEATPEEDEEEEDGEDESPAEEKEGESEAAAEQGESTDKPEEAGGKHLIYPDCRDVSVTTGHKTWQMSILAEKGCSFTERPS